MATTLKSRTNGSTTSRVASTNGKALVEKQVEIPSLELRTLRLELVGTSPLIMHAWSEKAKKMMRDKQQKNATIGKSAKNPEQEFEDAKYVIDRKKKIYGVPAIAFKAAAVEAANDMDLKKTTMRKAFHITNGQSTPQGDLIPLSYSKIVMREDMVRVGMGTADMRYRPEFHDWKVVIEIEYNARTISAEQIIILFDHAGFGVGIGDWRPEKNGEHGRFTAVAIQK